MTTLTFDTHEFVKKLKSVGFSEEQADLATKRDLREMELRLELKIAENKADLIH
jgi:hypothetical protein